jgi:diguanylate cyclase (GGDEF)-like protein/PAS domain S-box-containing protein
VDELLKVLLVEDDPLDAEIVLRELKNGDFEYQSRRVDTEADFRRELVEFQPNVILSDFSMPRFDGKTALAIARKTHADIPFIFVSGTIGEHVAVEAMKAGANDYVMKGNLVRLLPTVKRELREAEVRRARRAAEEALREKETQHRELIEQASDGIFVTDAQGNFKLVNPRYCEMLGYSEKELLRLNVAATYVEDERPVLARRLADLGGIGGRLIERMMRRKDGTLFPVEVSIRRLSTGTNQGIVRDVTERLEAARALAESEFRFRQLTENITEVFWLTDPSKNEMLYISPAYEKIWGRSCEALRASPRDWLDAIHPEDRERVLAAAVAKQAQGDYDEEYRIVRPDGSIRWIRDRAFPIADPEGHAYRIAGVAEDITEEKRAELLLRLEHAVARRLADANNASEGLIAVIRAICETERWECGRYFRVDEKAGVLRFGESWSVPDPSIVQFVAGSRDLSFAPGVGLAGQAWQSGEPLWTTDVSQDPRVIQVSLASEAGIRGVFVFPVMWEGKAIGVLAFSSREVREPEERLLQSVRVISHQIGQFHARMAQQERIANLNRIYAVLSGINTLIVRARHREELFRGACRIAVEAGKFRMAWIGLVDKEAKLIRSAASAGAVGGFFEQAPLALGQSVDSDEGLAPRAVRQREPVVSGDIQNDPRSIMREACRERGIRSVSFLPLLIKDEAVGVLGLYSGEAGFFDEEEMKLLLELAGDISFALDHIEKADRLDYLAHHDATTGVANRKLLLERLDQRIRFAAQRKGRLALAILDVERFKSINDTLGRHAGDQLLKALAERFVKFLDDPDRLGRVLGDQFGIVIPDARSEDEVARRIDQKLKECVGAPIRVGSTELRISAKAGIALYPDDGTDADTLFRNAEAALKRAKEAGERYLFYTQQMTERVGENLALENRLRAALEKEEFVLHYQPKVDTSTRRIEGVEALIRWQSRELGLVPPMHFIPLLEETGLILEVGAWALRRAALDYQRWAAQGLHAPRVAVNVSAIQMRQRDFVGTALALIETKGGRSGIDLEVTESLVMEDIEANIAKFEALRIAGMEIGIDDFGTGYSSLGYLAKLPVQSLKIDRSFVISMLSDSAVMTLVSTIVSLAHSLKLKVVAEGVDSEEQASALERLGCDQLQGFLICRPRPFDEIAKLLGPAADARAR